MRSALSFLIAFAGLVGLGNAQDIAIANATTDTGFLTDYDVKEEYRQLGLAGLSFHDVLAMLTTSPAAKFKVSTHSGTIGTGYDGDLTILLADPAAGELQDFSRVAYAIRGGRVIFDATAH